MNIYFHKWRLKPNPAKTEVCAFHLNNKEAKVKLEVEFDEIRVSYNFCPKYLGITLDRALTIKAHLITPSKKIQSRCNLVQILAGTGWSADAKTLRIATLGLVYSTAEFGYQIWCNSAHVNKVDTQLNSVMRTINGTVKSTPL